jgi:hypothetical protein
MGSDLILRDREIRFPKDPLKNMHFVIERHLVLEKKMDE